MSRKPTGRLVEDGGVSRIVMHRTFRAPIEDVWASVTESHRLERWIGSYTGDPADGWVTFRMNAEDGDAEGRMEIRSCRPPHHLALTTRYGEESWLIDLDLHEDDGGTTLEFSQVCSDPEMAASMGAGWEYYLDRLVAAEAGDAVDAVDFDRDYYPAMAAHFRRLFD